MEAAPPRPRPPCGLTRQEVLALDERNRVPVVGGRCQNPYDDAAGVEHKCGRTVGAHPSETAPAGKMTPPLLYSALTQLIPLIASVIYIFSDSSSSFSSSLRTDSREGPGSENRCSSGRRPVSEPLPQHWRAVRPVRLPSRWTPLRDSAGRYDDSSQLL